MSSLGSSPAANSSSPIRPASSAFGPEFNLLLACSAVGKREGSARQGSLPERSSDDLRACLEVPLDWQRVLTLAEQHSVTPPVYQVLREIPGAVPGLTLDELARRYQHNARRNLRFAAELIRILDGLDAHSVEAMPYKGPALAQSVYGDLALREFSDLDILVRPADVSRALEALKALGFAPSLHLTPAEQRAYLRSGCEYTLDGAAGKNLLELQWGIVPRFYAVDFEMDSFFERASPAEVAGRTVRTLSAEDLLLVLCVHAAKHAWIRLGWLRDIAGLVGSHWLNWDAVLSQAGELGIERILGLSLTLAGRLLGASVPEAALHRWRSDSGLRDLCDQIGAHIPESHGYSTESVGYFRLMLRLRERASDKARFASRLALTPGIGEWSTVRLPAPLFPLYRGIRLFRLAARVFSASATG
jgi:hypothetical protein